MSEGFFNYGLNVWLSMYTQKTNKCTLRHTNTDASAVCTLALCNTENFDIGPIPNKCRANITDTNTDTDTF